jgi:hypothetical protein
MSLQPVFAEGHVAFSEISPLVEHCKRYGITLFVKLFPNGSVAMETPGGTEVPEKGRLYQLCEPAQRKDEVDDGIAPRPAPVWVTQEMLTKLMPSLDFHDGVF